MKKAPAFSATAFSRKEMSKHVTIVGGGLAGLTLGIGLRQRDVPVTIHEAGNYPRHRVCGEFISGEGQVTLSRLGLNEIFERAGAVRARTAAFFTEIKSMAPRPLPMDAICLSRFVLDAALADKFRELGGELIIGKRFTQDFGEGIVRATGRRVSVEIGSERWFGLKIHARQIALVADLEMHLLPHGYIGLCKINDGEVNICGLFRKPAKESSDPIDWRERLRGQAGSPLHERLINAKFVEDSFCAVAGISLRPQQATDRSEVSVGDAVTMIPPVTGNGMSMAFESAELALAPLVAWSQSQASWDTARQKIAQDCDANFARRLMWAKWLQRFLLAPFLQNTLFAFAGHSDWFWRAAFARTRG